RAARQGRRPERIGLRQRRPQQGGTDRRFANIPQEVPQTAMTRTLLLAAFLLVPAWLLADELPQRITICTWNLEWFFDSYTSDNQFDVPKEQSPPNRGEWDWKLGVTADAIAKMNPTILCLQEVESRATVSKLVKRLKDDHKIEYKIAFVEGTD